MTFDLIIPTFNNLNELKLCLDGFTRQTFGNYRALVCVDGSTDGTMEWLRSGSFAFELIILEHDDKLNHGRNATRNLALPQLRSGFLCFFDSDIVPAPNLLERHAGLLSRRDCVSVGDVRYLNAGTNAWAGYAQTRGKNKFGQGEEIPYYYLATGNCAHATRYFAELGGQDPRMARYGGGDTEYAIRLHKHAALPVIFNAEAQGESEMNKTLAQALEQMEEFGRTNLRYIHAKHSDESRLFYLHLMIGTSFRAKLFRLMLSRTLSRMIQAVVPFLPQGLGNRLINYCVVTRIWTGWRDTRAESRSKAT